MGGKVNRETRTDGRRAGGLGDKVGVVWGRFQQEREFQSEPGRKGSRPRGYRQPGQKSGVSVG